MFLLISTILFLFTSAGTTQLESRIVGGKDVSIIELSAYAVSIRTIDNVHFCTGIIISEYHVLTAASCFNSDRDKPQDLIIYYDTTRSNGNDGKNTLVTKIVIHPDYDKELNLHNLAVVSVKNRLSDLYWSKRKIKVACTDQGEEVFAAGWGSESSNSSDFTSTLKQLTLQVVANSVDCINNNMFFCAAGTRNGTVCHGDEGGPVVNSDSKLVGVITKIDGECIPGKNEKFTRICNYKSWLDETAPAWGLFGMGGIII